MPNPFIHIELNTPHRRREKTLSARRFDGERKALPLPPGTAGPGEIYTAINVGGGTGGGIMRQMMPGAPSAWLAYALTKDIRGSTDKAVSLGATLLKDVTEVTGMGYISIIKDPTGAVLGLWQFTNP